MKLDLKSKIITVSWYIEGIDGYVVGDNKKMYKLGSRREIKMVLNGYSKGFYLNRKFYSLTRLRPLLRKIDV